MLSSINLDEVNSIFKKLITTISEQIHLEPLLDKNFYTICIVKNEISINHPFDFGVFRESKDNNINIQISENHINFLPIILLREAYRIFIPPKLRESIQIQIILYMIIEMELEKTDFINDWKDLIRSFDTYDYYFKNDFDTLIKFFHLEDPESKETVIPFIFQYIRKIEIISLDDKIFDRFVLEFINMMQKSLRADDVLETIRIIKDIFYQVKTYSALLHYKDFFKKMKERGEIITNLSLRKFSSNLRMLNRHSICSPNYKIDWNTINLSFFMVYLHFHPRAKWKAISEVINKLPFLLNTRISALGFSREIIGYFVIPAKYKDDLKRTLTLLKERGYLVDGMLFSIENLDFNLNLNYFRSTINESQFINPKSQSYKKNLELNLRIKYSQDRVPIQLSLLDFLILDRVKNISFTGFGFERRESTLSDLKTDLFNEIARQSKLITRLEKEIVYFQYNLDVQSSFVDFLNQNKPHGFFLVKKKLEHIILIANLLPKVFVRNQRISNIKEFKSVLLYDNRLGKIEDKLILNDKELISISYYELLPLLKKSTQLYERELNKYTHYYQFFQICSELKIYNIYKMLEIIKNFKIISKIYKVKQRKLNLIYDESRLREISTNDVENRLEEFATTNPPIIHPSLIESLVAMFFIKQFFILILKHSTIVIEQLKSIKSYFPYFIFQNITFNDHRYVFCEFGIPYLNVKERYRLLSILNNIFGKDLIIGNRFINPGIFQAFSRKDFYDFLNKKFYYTADLFEQMNIYFLQLLGMKEIPELENTSFNFYENLWTKEKSISKLLNRIYMKRYGERSSFAPKELNELYQFHIDLDNIILIDSKYNKVKNENFFKNYVKEIRFKPIWRNFKLQKFHLYLEPSNFNNLENLFSENEDITSDEIESDFIKLLLINTFTSIKFIPRPKRMAGFYIKYIFPVENPNNAFLNWLILSKKIVNSYILFTVKKTYEIMDFSKNLHSEGWNIDFNQFNSHIFKILFDKSYNPPKSHFKEKIINYVISGEPDFNPNSENFQDFLQVYNRKPINLKKLLQTKKGAKVEKIINNLLRNGLISTSLVPKNLQLRDRLIIIIPDVNESQKNILIDIFRYFNVVKISEIEGEYYIHSFLEKKNFSQGLLVKISIPNVEISPYFQRILKLFEYLELKYYLITTELYDGSNLIEKIYETPLDAYNPLNNLVWDDYDKKWNNHKLFIKGFKPIYPNLF